MKEWHDTQKEIVIPLKTSRRHNRKVKVPAEDEVIPVPKVISHFVMNLPATAIEFLGVN